MLKIVEVDHSVIELSSCTVSNVFATEWKVGLALESRIQQSCIKSFTAFGHVYVYTHTKKTYEHPGESESPPTTLPIMHANL